jgi:pyridoxamine 5'-phosphate oxidase
LSAPAGGDPLARFRERFAAAHAKEPADPTAAALATATADGRPSVRIVLVKDCDARGFRFFTNHGSRKAAELAANPRAALCFHWPSLGEQVRVEGDVERLPDAESDAYFAARPRVSQLGAWASQQSRPLAARAELLERLQEVEARYPADVPRPPFWGGYRLVPETVEFWRAGEFRLHEREVYRRQGDGWAVEALYP